MTTTPAVTIALCLAALLALATLPFLRRKRRARRRLQRFANPGQAGRTGEPPSRGAGKAGIRRLTAATALRLASPGKPRRSVITFGATSAALLGWLVAGPVAAVAAAGYLSAAATIALRIQDTRRADRSRAAALEAVTALSADLRAGLPPTTALAAAWPSLSSHAAPPHSTTTEPRTADSRTPGSRTLGSRTPGSGPVEERAVVVVTDPVQMLRGIAEPARAVVAGRLATAWQLAESSGVPLADILDRLDTEFRDRELVRLRSAAQVSGARVTTALLAVLPAAGLLLGAGIGAHPLHVILRTPIGAGCALGAMVLQLLGVLWSARLSQTPDIHVEAADRAAENRPATQLRGAPARWVGAS